MKLKIWYKRWFPYRTRHMIGYDNKNGKAVYRVKWHQPNKLREHRGRS